MFSLNKANIICLERSKTCPSGHLKSQPQHKNLIVIALLCHWLFFVTWVSFRHTYFQIMVYVGSPGYGKGERCYIILVKIYILICDINLFSLRLIIIWLPIYLMSIKNKMMCLDVNMDECKNIPINDIENMFLSSAKF